MANFLIRGPVPSVRRRRRPPGQPGGAVWLALSVFEAQSAAGDLACGYHVNAVIATIFAVAYFDEFRESRIGRIGILSCVPAAVWIGGALAWLVASAAGLR